ncbi:hypothetical protein STSP2_01086 [Anaerohalosphaera lusitana]|uniref:Uncharacterized protein n=1 Tax=Anaerohalosphaera lusitana TaxID=1936003 RepID=A0A1U9NJM4_9BACT|nr:hypothetical protein [Anaerohalosphaera lusitana]AQT67934.1 hypothetical protein STSP2_01086 [Anaerohalosphaera lusitana]
MSSNAARITAISPKKAAEILRKSGSKFANTETISADIKAGAPVNEDGTINIVEYAAWLVKEDGRGD